MNGFIPLINKVPLTNMPDLPMIEADCCAFHFARKSLDHEFMNQFVFFFCSNVSLPSQSECGRQWRQQYEVEMAASFSSFRTSILQNCWRYCNIGSNWKGKQSLICSLNRFSKLVVISRFCPVKIKFNLAVNQGPQPNTFFAFCRPEQINIQVFYSQEKITDSHFWIF